MPRAPRLLVAGGIYHVTARGNRRQAIFLEDADYRRFLDLLADAAGRLAWRCYAYCLMPNHYHLVVQTPNADLSAGIQRLNGVYAQLFNRRAGLNGHLFQGRFHAVLVESEWHLLELSRYLALNPVRGGLCATAVDWQWSSYRAVAGLVPAPLFLAAEQILDHFGSDGERARVAFRAFVHELAPRKGATPALFGHGQGSDPGAWLG